MFDAFAHFPGSSVHGETKDDDFGKKKAFEILSFEIGAENNVNIGSISGGAGAGKASFKELNITKKTDTASCDLFRMLCVGEHFPAMEIELRRQGGLEAGKGKSGITFLKWEFAMVMIQDISWSGSDGDDICEETLVLQFGAMKVTYTPQSQTGAPDKKNEKMAEWSRVLNKEKFKV